MHTRHAIPKLLPLNSRNSRLVMFTLCGLILGGVSVFATSAFQQNQAIGLVKKLRAKYASLSAAKISVVRTQYTNPKPKVTKFALSFAKPNKFYAEVAGVSDDSARIIDTKVWNDGRNLTIAYPAARVTLKSTPFSMSLALPGNLETLGLWDSARQFSISKGGNMAESKLRVLGSSQKVGGISCKVLEETVQFGQNTLTVRYFVDESRTLILKTETWVADKLLSSWEVKSIQLNPQLPASIFSTTPGLRYDMAWFEPTA